MTNHYCKSKEIRDLVVAAQETGIVSERLIDLAMQICKGIWSRGHYAVPVQDAMQEMAVWVLLHFRKIRVDGNVFSYLTTCAANMMKQTYRNAKNYEKLKAKYGDKLRREDKSGRRKVKPIIPD